MSWGAFNICSDGHPIHHNVDSNFGAKVGVRYAHEFNANGIKFWSTPKGAMLEGDRLARGYESKTYLYEKGQSPSPPITFYHGNPDAGTDDGPPWKIATLNGYNVRPDGPYFATFQNQCDRLWIGQNAYHWHDGTNPKLNIGSGAWHRPAKVAKSNVMSDQNHYRQRPYMAPTMPYDPLEQKWGQHFQTRRGILDWVNTGWAYKKENREYNSHSQHEFGWEINGTPDWETISWDVSPVPTLNLDKNLLYLVENRYSHGPNCNLTHEPFTERNCNDRKLTGYVSHYWVKTAPDPSQFNADSLLNSWFDSDYYPYLADNGYRRNGWPPYSLSCGSTAFQRARVLSCQTPSLTEPWYAKTESAGVDKVLSNATAYEYNALCERIPAGTAFDLIVYLQVIGYVICERALTYPTSGKAYHKKIYPAYGATQKTAYFNTICHCLFHQIAPLPPKP